VSFEAVAQGQSLGFRADRLRRVPRPAPQPVSRLATEAGRNGVLEDVPDRIRQVLVAFDHPGRESLLEQVPLPAVPTVKALRVDPDQAVHRSREPLLPPFDDQVEVGAQQAPGVEAESEAAGSLPEEDGERLAVGVVEKDEDAAGAA
jgi:hypothetical protein